MTAITNFKNAQIEIAKHRDELSKLHLRIADIQNSQGNTNAFNEEISLLKGQRRKLKGLLFLGLSKESTKDLDNQIAELEKTAKLASLDSEGREAAIEILEAEALPLGLAINQIHANLPSLKHEAALEIANEKASHYRAKTDAYLNALVEMIASINYANTLVDINAGLMPISFDRLGGVALPTAQLEALEGYGNYHDLHDEIKMATKFASENFEREGK